ncbi:MAG: anti-sigma factor [Microthrixaceae bacterium]
MSDDFNPDEDFDTAGLSGLFALDALEGDDLRRFERHLEVNPEAGEEVAGFHETAARLAALSSDQPSTALRGEVLSRLGDIRQEPVRLDVIASRGRSRILVRLASVAAAVVLVGLIGLGGYLVGSGSGSEPEEAARPTQDIVDLVNMPDMEMLRLGAAGEPTAVLLFSSSERKAMVMADDMASPPEGHVYEFWHVRGDSAKNVGMFSPDPDGVVHKSIDVDLAPGDVVGVTIEPAGGSDKPTTPMIMSATV